MRRVEKQFRDRWRVAFAIDKEALFLPQLIDLTLQRDRGAHGREFLRRRLRFALQAGERDIRRDDREANGAGGERVGEGAGTLAAGQEGPREQVCRGGRLAPTRG